MVPRTMLTEAGKGAFHPTENGYAERENFGLGAIISDRQLKVADINAFKFHKLKN